MESPSPYKEMTDQFWKTYREVVEPKRVIVQRAKLQLLCRPCPCNGVCLCTNAERSGV